MTKGVAIGLDLLALGLLIAYWEWRYQTEGWGRGWMRQINLPKHRSPSHIEELVWGTRITVRTIPKGWEFNLPLPGKQP
jgi:hypothetical protein